MNDYTAKSDDKLSYDMIREAATKLAMVSTPKGI